MSTPEFIDQIPDYFAGDLSLAERQAFAVALEKDAALKEAVAIWQEMDEVLAPAPEDKLLENIARLKAASAKDSRKRFSPWKLAFPAFLLIAALSWYLWPVGKATAPAAETTVTEAVDSPQAPIDTLLMVPEVPVPEDTVAPPPESAPPFRRIPPPPEEEGKEEEPSPPVFAANYDFNPLIEAEMTEQLRGGEVALELTNPLVDATVLATNGAIPLTFSGEVTTGLVQNELSIMLRLLSNTVEDYQQSNFIVSLPAQLTPIEDGYTLTIDGSAAVQPGLYYYFLEWEEEETYLKIGRLRVE